LLYINTESLAFSIVELPAAMYYRDPYRDRLRHGWTCRVLNGEVEVAIDAPVVLYIWRLQHLLSARLVPKVGFWVMVARSFLFGK